MTTTSANRIERSFIRLLLLIRGYRRSSAAQDLFALAALNAGRDARAPVLRRGKSAKPDAVKRIRLPRHWIVLQILIAHDLDRQDHANAAQVVLLRDAIVNDSPVCADAEICRARQLLLTQHLDFIVAGILV